MEFIKINKEKVKIMLSPEDMDEYNINCDMLDGADFRGREAFREILRAAEDKCGFMCCGKRIFVQIFPSKEGGCEMFVTRLNEIDSDIGSLTGRKSYTCYAFIGFNNLLKCCKTALHNGYADVSEAYIDEMRKCYYLCVGKDLPFAAEFGGKKCSHQADAYVKEHCKLFSNSAVKSLSEFI